MDKNYNFYGWETADVSPAMYGDRIRNPREMYDILLRCWSRDTCAPRMQDRWSEDNPIVGQCSITAFLVQDIFGGKVYGIRRPDGNYHCYNVVPVTDDGADRKVNDDSGIVGDDDITGTGGDSGNIAGYCIFDLTSEQFGDEKLDYSDNPEQLREVHFAKEEKKARYEVLKERVLREMGR